MKDLKELRARPKDSLPIVKGILNQAKKLAKDTKDNVHQEEGTSAPEDLDKQIDEALKQFLKPTVKRN